MLKKIIKSIIKESINHKHRRSSSDAWKYYESKKYGKLGHHHYKHKRKSGSFLSSFFSS